MIVWNVSFIEAFIGVVKIGFKIWTQLTLNIEKSFAIKFTNYSLWRNFKGNKWWCWIPKLLFLCGSLRKRRRHCRSKLISIFFILQFWLILELKKKDLFYPVNYISQYFISFRNYGWKGIYVFYDNDNGKIEKAMPQGKRRTGDLLYVDQ